MNCVMLGCNTDTADDEIVRYELKSKVVFRSSLRKKDVLKWKVALCTGLALRLGEGVIDARARLNQKPLYRRCLSRNLVRTLRSSHKWPAKDATCVIIHVC